MVGCIPREDDGRKATEPDSESIATCKPRLEQFIEIAKPRLIVAVGVISHQWLKPGFKDNIKLKVDPMPEIIELIHPAAILRATIAHKGLMTQRATVTLSNAIEDL